eukprot:scaffold140779_cov45-Attheya_sp.AAC.3
MRELTSLNSFVARVGNNMIACRRCRCRYDCRGPADAELPSPQAPQASIDTRNTTIMLITTIYTN